MIVVVRDTEQIFLKELDFLLERSSQRRCLYVRLSRLAPEKQEWFSALGHALEDIADGHVGQTYVCADGDLFVIMPHLTDKHLQKLIAAQQADTFQTVPADLFSLHDIKTDYAFLRDIVQQKIEALQSGTAGKGEGPAEDDSAAFPDHPATSVMATHIQEKRLTGNEINILICEDDSLTRMMIRNVLMQDFTVHIAKDAHSALSLYPEIAPDAVFLDIGLPDASGQDVLKHILRMDPQASIIMFSGRNDQDNILKALRSGAAGFIAKPFTRGKLYQYIDQCPSVQIKRERQPGSGYKEAGF